jgi:hypothetical protein
MKFDIQYPDHEFLLAYIVLCLQQRCAVELCAKTRDILTHSLINSVCCCVLPEFEKAKDGWPDWVEFCSCL